MKRLLLDTNIYGLLFADPNFHHLHEKVQHIPALRIYGYDIIRKELKAAPRRVIRGVNIRASLLRAYSAFVVKEYATDGRLSTISASYHTAYRQQGGLASFRSLENDFLIVACAAVHGIDIVVSEDNATMLNELALRSYASVNRKLGIRTPSFIGYENFKRAIQV